VLDAVLIAAVTVVLETLVWVHRGLGDPIKGPQPVMALLPLLMAVPLWWRRRYPLLVCTLVMAGPAFEALISGQVAENVAGVVTAGVVSYSVAAYSPRPRALLGLAVVFAGYAARSAYDRNVQSGRASELWAASFFGAYLLASWLVGAVRQARRESRLQAERAAATQREAELAVAEERARIARDLHDIVSHNLSVVIVQAAGGRAQLDGEHENAGVTLEKIESSGRQALAEMRRLLGVLRTDDEHGEATLAPAPGLADLPVLVDSVRAAGVDVSLHVDLGGVAVPPAVDVSGYRIAQEALTNVIKHAGPSARADVHVWAAGGDLIVSVENDGSAPGIDSGHGHGLRGMRERVGLLGGELLAQPRTEGGFELRARLPLAEPT
jgi:signal transduction histidine kinase